MLTVKFKAKERAVYHMDDTLAWHEITVPTIGRKHCDMEAFRASRAFGGFANSDMFPAMLARALKRNGIGAVIKDTDTPPCVSVDRSGFLAEVTITLPDDRGGRA